MPDEKLTLLLEARNAAQRALDSFQKGTKKATKEMDNMGKTSKKTNVSMQSIAKTFALIGGAAGLIRFFTSATKAFIGFEARMAEVNTLVRLNSEGIDVLSDSILEMTKRVPKSAEELGAGLYQIISAGIKDTSDALNILEISTRLAVGGVADVGSTVKLVTGIINGYGFSMDEAANVSDILFKTVENGVTTIAELANSLGRVVPIAKSAGIGLEEVTGSMALLTTRGLNTAEATTALSGAILNIFAPTDAAQKALKKLGISIKDSDDNMLSFVDVIKQFEGRDLAAIKKLIPEKAAAIAVLTLADNYKTLGENIEGAFKAGGSSLGAFQIQMNTTQARLQILSNTYERFKIGLGAEIGGGIASLQILFDELGKGQTRLLIPLVDGFDALRVAIEKNAQEAKVLNDEIERMAKALKPIKVAAPILALPEEFKLPPPEFSKEELEKIPDVIPAIYQKAFLRLSEIQQTRWVDFLTLEQEGTEKIKEIQEEADIAFQNMKAETEEREQERNLRILQNNIDVEKQISKIKLEENGRRNLEDEKTMKKRIAMEKLVVMNISGALTNLAGINRSASKENFAVWKSFAVGQATVSGILSVVNAAATVPFVPAGLAASALALSAYVGNLAAIKAQSFQTREGEFKTVPGPPFQAVPAVVHGGEVIGRPAGGVGTTLIIQGDFLSTDESADKITELLFSRSQFTGQPVSAV